MPSGGGWTEQILHTFTSVPDGGGPYGGVIFDSGGNLYGTTSSGGILNSNCFYVGDPGCGVVYEISP
jgi:isoaspartyl peptidase/L-asparaginase-like protein (Ntn-hydrolase superfamily)